MHVRIEPQITLMIHYSPLCNGDKIISNKAAYLHVSACPTYYEMDLIREVWFFLQAVVNQQ